MRLAVLLTAAAVVAGSLAASAPSAIHGRLCGQIGHGPKNAWTWAYGGRTTHFHGDTWSVFALPAVPCSAPMKAARGLLAAWSAAKPGATLSARGWICDKVGIPASFGGGSDGVSCADYGGDSAKTFAIVMLAPYSPADALKRLNG